MNHKIEQMPSVPSAIESPVGDSVGETIAAAMNTARVDALDEAGRVLDSQYIRQAEAGCLLLAQGTALAAAAIRALKNATPQGRQFQKDGSKPAESASVPCVVEASSSLPSASYAKGPFTVGEPTTEEDFVTVLDEHGTELTSDDIVRLLNFFDGSR